MRLATFNILNGRAPGSDRVEVAAFAEAVRGLDADVLALQEVDRNQPRSGHADLTAVAAEAMGAVEHRFVAALSGSPGSTWTAATGEEQPDEAGYGIGLLSRHPVTAWQIVRLPVLRVPGLWRFHGSRRPSLVHDEPRVAVAARIEGPLGPVTVVNTHLSYLSYWNGRQLHSLMTALRPAERPLVLTGDLNMGATRATTLSGLRSLAAHPTFPVDAPRLQLDHVLVDGPLGSSGSATHRLPVSDHRALVVDLTRG